MMTANQCRVRAADCDQRSADCAEPNLREELRQMGETWRYVARQAEWQDNHAANLAHEPIR